ncbi:MAG TPA: Rieske 2Fe-2S domain-containing protein [Cellvibrionaceae bacterium]
MQPSRLYLCQWEDVAEGSCRGFRLQAEASSLNLLAVKKQGVLYVYENLCPHAWIPLEWVEHQFLNADNSLIQCANHGALFTIEQGRCIAGPCAGQALTAIATERQQQAVYALLPANSV